MSALLDVFSQSARNTRRWLLYTAYGSALALLPAGIVIERRHNPLQHQTGIGMVVGGAAPLAFSWLLSRPSPVEQLANSFEAMRVPGADNRELVRRTEQAWQAAAETAYKRRKISGAITLALGIACTVTGITFLLRDHVGGMSRNDQYTVGSSLLGPGVPFATQGARSLIVPSTEEVGWAAYRAATMNSGSVPLGLAAFQHGAMAASGFSF